MRVVFLAVGVVIATACADLPQVEHGTCGNLVLETGEDCDTPHADPFVCRSCKFDCTTTSCPTGYGCGADFVCRKPTGSFDLAGPDIPVDAQRLEAADFDGDHRADVVAETIAEFRVHYFDGRADPTRTFSVLGAAPHVTSALGSKPLATLATSIGSNVAVWRGQRDRTLATTLYPALAVAPFITEARVFVTDVLPPVAGPRFIADEYMLGITFGMGATLSLGTFDPFKQPFFAWNLPLAQVIGPVFGRFFNFSNCDTMVFAYSGSTQVQFFPLCNGAGQANTGGASIVTHTTFGIGTIVAGLINADTIPDLAMQSTAGHAIEIAYGNGIGFEFFSHLVPSPQPIGALLAVGDVDGDSLPDWVESAGVHLSTSNDQIAIPALLTKAMILDANADGLKDIVAIGPGGAFFVFGTGTPLLTTSFRALDGTPKQLVISDFDGDKIQDVLVGTDLGGQSAKLWIQWGREKQFPEAPVAVGSLVGSAIEDMAAGIVGPYLEGSTTGAAIAPILSRRLDTQTLEAPVLFGSPSRVLQSPFGITRFTPMDEQRGNVLAIIAGHFGTDHEGLVFVTQDNDQSAISHAIRLWGVPSTGDAQLDPSALARAAQPLPLAMPAATLDPRRFDVPLGAAVDLDGDGTDEVVLLAPPDATVDGRRGALLVVRVGADAEMPASQDIGAALKGTKPVWTLHAADVDGDGRKDVLLLLTDSIDHWVVRVLFNRGDGTLDVGRAVDVVLPDEDVPLDVATIRTDPNTTRRALAIGGAAGVYLLPWTGSSFGAAQNLSSAGATTIAAGDVDGDGVEDLVVGREGTVSVWFQRAAGEK
jgi:hypothetical protein